MDREKVKELALAAGFKLKEQEGREPDLNNYVYAFVDSVMRQLREEAREFDCVNCEHSGRPLLTTECKDCFAIMTRYTPRDGS